MIFSSARSSCRRADDFGGVLALILKDDGDFFGVVDDMVVRDNVTLRIDDKSGPESDHVRPGARRRKRILEKAPENWSNGVPPGCGAGPCCRCCSVLAALVADAACWFSSTEMLTTAGNTRCASGARLGNGTAPDCCCSSVRLRAGRGGVVGAARPGRASAPHRRCRSKRSESAGCHLGLPRQSFDGVGAARPSPPLLLEKSCCGGKSSGFGGAMRRDDAGRRKGRRPRPDRSQEQALLTVGGER